MSNPFFERPILNSPYERPKRHWELDAEGQPTQKLIETRRKAEFITPIPTPRKRKGPKKQEAIIFDEGKGLSTKKQQYDPTGIINLLRSQVDEPHRPEPPPRGHEHGREARPTRRTGSLRGLGLDAHRGLGREHGDARPGHPRLRHPTSLRAGHRARSSPPVLRAQRRRREPGPLQRRVCRHPRHPLQLHREAGDRPAPAAAGDDHGQGDAARARCPGDPLPARGGLPRRTNRRTPHRHVQRRLHPRTHARPRGRHGDTAVGHHRRAGRPQPRPHQGRAPVAGPLRTDVPPRSPEVARSGRRTAAQPLRPAQANRASVARRLPHLQRRHLPRPASLQDARRHGLQRIIASINRAHIGQSPITAVLNADNPIGSTAHVKFATSRTDRWEASSERCQVNWIILDRDWEAEFCRVAEKHPRVRRYVKNHNLGLEVPYRYGSETRRYIPDFIVLIEDGHGEDDLLHLIVEIKGYRKEDAKEKKATMETMWVPGVNHQKRHGRWAFAEFTEVYMIEADFKAKVEGQFDKMVAAATKAGG